jgi:radical SAM superfamily enzyme YgiQ (UPF0313 family)
MPAPDVLLINPAGRARAYQALAVSLAAVEPPIWAALIASGLRRRGVSCRIIDANAEGLSPEEVAREVVRERPVLSAVVVYGHQPSASTQNMPAASALVSALKQADPSSRVLLLGGHAAALPERTLREEAADFVCAGEGLITILDLLPALKAGSEDYRLVRDLWYRDAGGCVRRAPPAPLLRDLDTELPGAAWDLLPMDRYRAHNWHCFGSLDRQPYAALYTALGCPFRCEFCCIQAPFRSGERVAGRPGANSYRMWSAGMVLSEIDLLVQRYGVRNIKFADELFLLNRSHVESICDGLIARGYDLNIWAYARLDTVGGFPLDKLKRAGIRWLALGIETASPRVLRAAGKGSRCEDVRRTVGLVRSAGINIIGNYIFGLPEDDLDSMRETLELALSLRCEYANFYCAMAYPGSRLYERALRENLPLPETWSGYSQLAEDALPLPTGRLSGAEVLRFRDRAFQTYFSDPGYLALIRDKFGPATAQEILGMTKQRLKRKYA